MSTARIGLFIQLSAEKQSMAGLLCNRAEVKEIDRYMTMATIQGFLNEGEGLRDLDHYLETRGIQGDS
jgi:hypothetical protein